MVLREKQKQKKTKMNKTKETKSSRDAASRSFSKLMKIAADVFICGIFLFFPACVVFSKESLQ